MPVAAEEEGGMAAAPEETGAVGAAPVGAEEGGMKRHLSPGNQGPDGTLAKLQKRAASEDHGGGYFVPHGS